MFTYQKTKMYTDRFILVSTDLPIVSSTNLYNTNDLFTS